VKKLVECGCSIEENKTVKQKLKVIVIAVAAEVVVDLLKIIDF